MNPWAVAAAPPEPALPDDELRRRVAATDAALRLNAAGADVRFTLKSTGPEHGPVQEPRS